MNWPHGGRRRVIRPAVLVAAGRFLSYGWTFADVPVEQTDEVFFYQPKGEGKGQMVAMAPWGRRRRTARRLRNVPGRARIPTCRTVGNAQDGDQHTQILTRYFFGPPRSISPFSSLMASPLTRRPFRSTPM